MLAPIWLTIRLGPYLRRERDKRRYETLFKPDAYVAGMRRAYRLMFLEKTPEGLDSGLESEAVVVFSGMQGLFNSFLGRHAELKCELERITRTEYLPKDLPERFIAIHVRRGDFAAPHDNQTLYSGGVNYRIPIEWYRDCICNVRSMLGTGATAIVFSDGTESELDPVLRLENVHWLRDATAITDLLALSRARVIVASKSTFSM